MGKPKLIIHPITGECHSQKDWAEILGISDSTLGERLNKFSVIKALTPGSMFDRYKLWSEEENEYLIEVAGTPNLQRLWNQTAAIRGWIPRTKQAINNRISLFQRQGKLTFDKTKSIKNGWIIKTCLADILGISYQVIDKWIADFGLRAYHDKERLTKIHLQEFISWAVSPDGAGQLAKALKSNPLAITWLLRQIDTWIFEERPILGKGLRTIYVKPMRNSQFAIRN